MAVDSKELSFIIPIRGRDDQIQGLIHTIRPKYSDYEIIFANQLDNKIFKHGQLRNLGYQKSIGKLVVFMDVDVRFLDYIDFAGAMERFKVPMVMFDKCYEVKEVNGEIVQVSRKFIEYCVGRLLCFTRQQFEERCGYSNLMAGYGWEDNTLYERGGKLMKYSARIGHVGHPWQRNTEQSQKRNLGIHQSDVERDRNLDGFHQTSAKFSCQMLGESIYYYCFWDIGVTEDFAYKGLLPKD